jgi:hypothetical protein
VRFFGAPITMHPRPSTSSTNGDPRSLAHVVDDSRFHADNDGPPRASDSRTSRVPSVPCHRHAGSIRGGITISFRGERGNANERGIRHPALHVQIGLGE